MATFLFDLPSAEVENGTESNDVFISSNNNFGAGDQAFGNGGIDDFQYFADSSLTGTGLAVNVFGGFTVSKTYAAFILNSVETFTTVNDSGAQLIFDMSSSSGITDLVVANSTSGVVYDEVNTLANIRLFDQTNAANANVAVGYDATLTATANTSVNLVMQATGGNIVRIGTATGTVGQPTNTGVETVRVSVLSGNSTIQTLSNASLVNLFFDDAPGAFNATIVNALSSTIRNVNNLSDGGATVSAAAASGSVTFTGLGGAENFTGGAFADTFNLGDGNNTASTGGGANTVNTGSGTDLVRAQGTTDTVNTGAGNDTIVDTTSVRLVANMGDGSDSLVGIGGNFNASLGAGFDSVDMGTGFDVVFVDAGTTDAQYRQITNLEGVAIYTAGATTLGGGVGGNAQAAGVNSIYLGSGSAGNDVVDASTFTTGLSVTSSGSNSAASLETAAGRIARFGGIDSTGGGDDTVTTGSGVDYFLFRGDNALTDADVLRAGLQNGAGGAVAGDTLVLEGDTTLAGGGSFAGFEFLALESAVGSAYRTQAPSNTFGNQYNLTITDANAPTTGALFINGSNLKGAVAGSNADETVAINATGVTVFGLDITTGGGADVIQIGGAGALAVRVVTQGGNDVVSELAGNTADDIYDLGVGNDTITLRGGNNIVFDQGSIGELNVFILGVGDDTIFSGIGNDIIGYGGIYGGSLTGADTLADGGGFDSILVNGEGLVDAQLAGVNVGAAVNGYERLITEGVGGQVFTLGANAARAGFIVIQDGLGSNTIDLTTGTFFDKAMQVDLRTGGNDVVLLGNASAVVAPAPTVPTPAGLFDFVGPIVPYAADPLTNAGDRTGNANLVLGGVGSQTITGGTGSDVYRISGTLVLDGTDVFAGGAGYDAIQFDNSEATVGGTVNLTNVTNVELYQITSSGDTNPVAVDVDNNVINFTGGAVGTLTTLKLDNSALTDLNDTTTFVLQAGLTDSDYAINVIGGAGATILDKQNIGINNNINFQGGSGMDWLLINGGDLGSTTVFDGAGGMDRIVQTGGVITDDDYFQVRNVEILTGTAVSPINATLGATAAASGMTTIIGTAGNDVVTLDPAFTANLAVSLGGGNDTFNGAGAQGTMTFSETLTNITAADVVSGGANGADVFNINAAGGGAADLTNVSGIEIYNITANGGNAIDLTLGAGTVTGAQTFNIIGNLGATNIATTIHGAAATANTVVNLLNGSNQVTLGGGNDIVNGGTLADFIYGGAGADTLRGFGGIDEITGGLGADTIDGGAGADKLRGQGGNDTILGGDGNDVIYGGAGGDLLDGQIGTDVYLYDGTTTGDSPFGARDTVRFGTGDTFDFGLPVTFTGNQANFADAQSSINAGGAIEAVFQADANILWLDVNNDGTLNNNDLQIQIQFADGLTGFTGLNFVNTTTVAAFDATFAPPV